MNSRLPADIAVLSAEVVPDNFHASRSAVGKTTATAILVAPQRSVERHNLVYHFWRPLEVEPMRQAAMRLVGTHDFRAALTSSSDQRDNTVRTIFRCDVAADGDEIHVTVQGNGFLYNMVRNIVGTLIEIGRGTLATVTDRPNPGHPRPRQRRPHRPATRPVAYLRALLTATWHGRPARVCCGQLQWLASVAGREAMGLVSPSLRRVSRAAARASGSNS